MKIRLNRHRFVGGWTALFSGASGAGAAGAEAGAATAAGATTAPATAGAGAGAGAAGGGGFTSLLQKAGSTDNLLGNVVALNREGGSVAPRPNVDDNSWIRLLMGSQ